MGCGTESFEAPLERLQDRDLVVGGARVGVQQTDRDGFGFGGDQGSDRRLEAVGVELGEDFPVWADTLGHADPERSRDDGSLLVDGEIVDLGACLAADLENVFESGGRDEAGARAAPFQQRVGRHGGSVNDIGVTLQPEELDPFRDRA